MNTLTPFVALSLLASSALAGASTSNYPGDHPGFSPRAVVPGTLTVTGTQTIAPLGECSRVDINIVGDVSGTNDLGGGSDQIRFSVYDDGAELDFEIVSIVVGQTVTIDVDLGFEGLYGQGAPGVGVYVFDGPSADFGQVLFDSDPFFPVDVAGTCGGAPIPLEPATPIPVNSPWAIGVLILTMFAVVALFRRRQLRT